MVLLPFPIACGALYNQLRIWLREGYSLPLQATVMSFSEVTSWTRSYCQKEETCMRKKKQQAVTRIVIQQDPSSSTWSSCGMGRVQALWQRHWRSPRDMSLTDFFQKLKTRCFKYFLREEWCEARSFSVAAFLYSMMWLAARSSRTLRNRKTTQMLHPQLKS